MKMAQPSISLELRHSRFWVVFVGLYSIALVIAIVLVKWPTTLQIGLVLAVLIFAITTSFHLIKLQNHHLTLNENTQIRSISLIHPWIVAFSDLDEHQKVRHWLVFPNQCSAAEFRQLRIWLRWEAKPT
jgi:hypothetical protein